MKLYFKRKIFKNLASVSSDLKFSTALMYRIAQIFVQDLVIFSASQTSKHIDAQVIIISRFCFASESKNFYISFIVRWTENPT